MLSFVLVVALVGSAGPPLIRVAAIDVGASLALASAWVINPKAIDPNQLGLG